MRKNDPYIYAIVGLIVLAAFFAVGIMVPFSDVVSRISPTEPAETYYANPHQDPVTLKIYFTRFEPNGDADILVMDQDGSNAREVFADPNIKEVNAARSPSGDYLAVMLKQDDDACNLVVYTTDVNHSYKNELIAAWDCDSLLWGTIFVDETQDYEDVLYTSKVDGLIHEALYYNLGLTYIGTFHGDWPKGTSPLVSGGQLEAYQVKEGVFYHDTLLPEMKSPRYGVSDATIIGECITDSGESVYCDYYSAKDILTVDDNFPGEDFEIGFTVGSMPLYQAFHFLHQEGLENPPSVMLRTSLFFVRDGQVYVMVYATNTETCLTCEL